MNETKRTGGRGLSAGESAGGSNILASETRVGSPLHEATIVSQGHKEGEHTAASEPLAVHQQEEEHTQGQTAMLLREMTELHLSKPGEHARPFMLDLNAFPEEDVHTEEALHMASYPFPPLDLSLAYNPLVDPIQPSPPPEEGPELPACNPAPANVSTDDNTFHNHQPVPVGEIDVTRQGGNPLIPPRPNWGNPYRQLRQFPLNILLAEG